MIDLLPFPALREIREISYILDRSARQIFLEKKGAMERGETGSEEYGRTRDLMSIMRE